MDHGGLFAVRPLAHASTGQFTTVTSGKRQQPRPVDSRVCLFSGWCRPKKTARNLRTRETAAGRESDNHASRELCTINVDAAGRRRAWDSELICEHWTLRWEEAKIWTGRGRRGARGLDPSRCDGRVRGRCCGRDWWHWTGRLWDDEIRVFWRELVMAGMGSDGERAVMSRAGSVGRGPGRAIEICETEEGCGLKRKGAWSSHQFYYAERWRGQ